LTTYFPPLKTLWMMWKSPEIRDIRHAHPPRERLPDAPSKGQA
jgi:hypothetical protein